MNKIFLRLFFIILLQLIAMHYGEAAIKHETAHLHLRTYLTPSIPITLYERMVNYINDTTNLRIALSVELMHSGPPPHLPNPFSTKEIDIGHLCSPPFIWLTSRQPSSIELLPIAPIFADERTNHMPIYFSDVIVAVKNPIQHFKDFRGKSWCYNDPESLSGYFCVLQKLADLHQTTTFFSRMHESGSHLTSIQLVAEGYIDGSAIDSNVLSLQLKAHPELKETIRIIESWGPFPIQPFVVSKTLNDKTKETLINALTQMSIDQKDTLADYLIEGFGYISDQDFNYERKLLSTCKHLMMEKKS